MYKLYHFIAYGFLGWIIEIVFTGIGSGILKNDLKLTAGTYLWMFPIYGLAVFFEPIHNKIRDMNWWIRGLFWTGLILIVEYISGFILKLLIGVCPWDYGGNNYSLDGLIRLDYTPFWFIAGFIFEKAHDLIDSVIKAK